MRFPVALRLHHHLVLSFFLILAIPEDMELYFTVFLICISPMAIEQFFMSMIAICISYVDKCLFKFCPLIYIYI